MSIAIGTQSLYSGSNERTLAAYQVECVELADESFAAYLRRHIVTSGLMSQSALSRATNIDVSYINKIAKGRVLRPEIETLEKLQPALKRPIKEIMRAAGYPEGAELSATGAGQSTGSADLTVSAELNQLADIGRAVLRIVEERQMLTEKRLEKVERAGRYFPVINRVPADDVRERDTQIEDRIKLDPFFWEDATDPRVYIVSGDCMVMSGIIDGDHVVIDAAETQPRNGQVVLAQLNNALTLKRFYRTAEGIELRPNAPGYDTIAVKPGDELVIVGCLHKVVPTGAR